jgi:hypothetical protein
MTEEHSAQGKTEALHVPISERSLTLGEFCEVENISRSFLNKLRKLNLGPHITEIVGPGLSLFRVTPEARREWHQRMKKYRESKQAQIAAERRHQQQIAAGQKSINSPHHISKQPKKKKKTGRR